MKVSRYIKEYTEEVPFTIKDVFGEIKELFEGIVKFNESGIKEEFEDVLHFFQLYLYWRFGIDGELWYITRHSVQKFMDRKLVWDKIYSRAGLDEGISRYCGNYKRMEKVVSHLGKFGVGKEKAEQVYRDVVFGSGR